MAAFRTKIYNLYRQIVRKNSLTYEKHLPYFENDDFPLSWHKDISESPSATSCVSTIQDFLEGSDFSDRDLGKRKVNTKGETFWQIHQKTCKDFGEFEGFAWLFRFNALGQVVAWEHLPFENCRLGKPDSQGWIEYIFYNPFFGTADYQLNKDSIPYHAYNPANVKAQYLKEGSKFQGQVFFFGTTTALSRFYPMPEAHSARKWMNIEAGVADYHDENINNGFLQPFMLAMIGNPDEPINNPDPTDTEAPQTRAEELDEVVSKNFMGAKRVGNMWISWFSNKDELPVPIAMPSNNSGDLFLAVDTQATKKITIAFKVPGILANINEGVSLGGDGNTVRVAVKLMQQRVTKRQRMLTDAYETVMKMFDRPYTQGITIAPYNPYPELEVVDQKVWDALTRQERRKWIEENTDIELFADDLAEEQPVLPAPAQARLLNSIPMPFPEKIRNHIKKTLEYKDKMGICPGGKGGRDIAEAIVNNQNLGLKALKRIHSYLKKRPEYANSAFSEGCNVIDYNAWGGKEMEVFLEGKLKELDAWLN